MPTWWTRPHWRSKSMTPIAQLGSRSMRPGKESSRREPMIQTAPSSHRNQTGDSRGPSSEAVARCEERTREELFEVDGAWPIVNELHHRREIVGPKSRPAAEHSSGELRTQGSITKVGTGTWRSLTASPPGREVGYHACHVPRGARRECRCASHSGGRDTETSSCAFGRTGFSFERQGAQPKRAVRPVKCQDPTVTVRACGPFGPSSTSYSTFAPSARLL